MTKTLSNKSAPGLFDSFSAGDKDSRRSLGQQSVGLLGQNRLRPGIMVLIKGSGVMSVFKPQLTGNEVLSALTKQI